MSSLFHTTKRPSFCWAQHAPYPSKASPLQQSQLGAISPHFTAELPWIPNAPAITATCLQAVIAQVESRCARATAQNSVLSTEIEALRAKESDMRQILRLGDDKLRKAEQEARGLRQERARLETSHAEQTARKQVMSLFPYHEL